MRLSTSYEFLINMPVAELFLLADEVIEIDREQRDGK